MAGLRRSVYHHAEHGRGTRPGEGVKMVRSHERAHLSGSAPLEAQTVKNPPAVQEAQVRSLGWEDPLEKGMATHSRTLA